MQAISNAGGVQRGRHRRAGAQAGFPLHRLRSCRGRAHFFFPAQNGQGGLCFGHARTVAGAGKPSSFFSLATKCLRDR
jgi:hypothetical protein